MKKKTIIILLILTISIYALNVNVQSAEENGYRPTSLELTPHDPISITSDSGFEVFPGTGKAEDPYLIEGYNITTTDHNGIYISGTKKYFIVRNCYIDAGNNGISIRDVADGRATFINNTCINNNGYGILLGNSNSSTVTNNTFSNNGYDGIYLICSGSSTVVNNTCNNNHYGIWLSFSGRSTIINNTFNNNNCKGISLWDSDSSTVANNMCSNNSYGIELGFSDYCVVAYNLLQENEGYGVELIHDSDNNLIHHNTFVDNNLGGTSQAFDDVINTFWYDTETKEGNYWSDWSGTGSYSIDGTAGANDLYPLDEPAEYSVESTTDKTQLNFIFTLLMLVIPLVLTRIVSKKVKK